MKRINRRDFLRLSGAAAASVALLGAGCAKQPATEPVSPSPAESSPTTRPTQSGPTSTDLPATSGPSGSSPTSPPLPATSTPAKSSLTSPTVTVTSAPTQSQAYLAVAHGNDPAAITKAVIAALGGIERFVKSGANVIIKPNICVDYHTPEYAATTNPDVVATVVTLCLGAGAKRVRVMDQPFGGTPASAYDISGIATAVKAAGGEMEVMSPIKYTRTKIPMGKDLKNIQIYKDILEADVIINIPIAKHHSLARLTLGGKNLLGTIVNPGQIHQNLGQRIADLVSVVKPTLTIVDAYRILMNHGPTGGSLDDVKETRTIIASHDLVVADSYATTLFNLTGADIPYIKAAAAMGLGTMDYKSVKLEEVNV